MGSSHDLKINPIQPSLFSLGKICGLQQFSLVTAVLDNPHKKNLSLSFEFRCFTSLYNEPHPLLTCRRRSGANFSVPRSVTTAPGILGDSQLNPTGSEASALCLDKKLLKLVEQGSEVEEKVSHLFQLLKEPLYRYLVLINGDRGEAEDLTQEVFLRLYKALVKGQVVDNPRGWVFKVARNLVIDQQRKKEPVELLDTTAWDLVSLEHLAPGVDPEQRVLNEEKQRKFTAVLQRLSVQERQCLYLKMEGLSYSEIAEAMGVRNSTVATFLSRGIRKIIQTYD